MDIPTLENISAVGSKLEKERLLRTLNWDTLRFLKWALDPMVTFGVTVDEDAHLETWRQTTTRMLSDDFWNALNILCGNLAERRLTGNDASEVVARIIMSGPTMGHVIWACRILNKDLRSGFSVSTLNKAHPGAIVPFAVALATPYDPSKHEIRGAWCVEPKLDGLRMVVLDGVAYTRNGRTIDSVGHILAELEPFKGTHVFDGEIMGVTNFDEDSGKIRKKGMGPNLSLRYNVFDCILKAEWNTRKTQSYVDRRNYLTEALGTANPRYIDIVHSNRFIDPTADQLFAARDRYIKMGYEGAMLKDLNSPYIFKRSDAILKLKDFTDADCLVVETYEGKGKHKGRLGGIKIELNGVVTSVGSGFSDEQRDVVWANRDGILGQIAEIQYQNFTEDGKMRFPVFIKFRPDKE